MTKGNALKKLIMVLPLVAIMLTGCSTITTQQSSASPEPVITEVAEAPASVEPEAPATGTVEALLNELTVQPEQLTNSAGEKYKRSMFMTSWLKNNSTNCDTRYAVLAAESLVPVVANGCDIVSGEWVSAYDNKHFTSPKKMDIDHMVPLAEAWRSGAFAWDSATREAYANDLGYSESLVAVSASSNRSKGDKDVTTWKPDTDACTYVGQWVAVKYRWNLTVDAQEKDSILTVLSFCEKDFAVEKPAKADVAVVDVVAPVETPDAVEAPSEPVEQGATDPQFSSCKEAKKNGYGPYVKGQHVEYDWYRDGDGDGTVCE